MSETSPIAAQSAVADRRRAKLDRNQDRSRLLPEPTLSVGDIRAFDKAKRRRDTADRPDDRAKASRAMRQVEDRLEARREAHWLDGAVSETIALAEESGAVVQRRADGGAQRIMGAGIGSLWKTGKLTKDQLQAAKRYGDDFMAAGVAMKSCLSGGNGGLSENVGLPPKLEYASFELVRAQTRGLLGRPLLIAICDDICGRGHKLSDLAKVHKSGKADSREVAVLEERLKTALDLLALHYGIFVGKQSKES